MPTSPTPSTPRQLASDPVADVVQLYLNVDEEAISRECVPVSGKTTSAFDLLLRDATGNKRTLDFTIYTTLAHLYLVSSHHCQT